MKRRKGEAHVERTRRAFYTNSETEPVRRLRAERRWLFDARFPLSFGVRHFDLSRPVADELELRRVELREAPLRRRKVETRRPPYVAVQDLDFIVPCSRQRHRMANRLVVRMPSGE